MIIIELFLGIIVVAFIIMIIISIYSLLIMFLKTEIVGEIANKIIRLEKKWKNKE